jgi:hypothetical protein
MTINASQKAEIIKCLEGCDECSRKIKEMLITDASEEEKDSWGDIDEHLKKPESMTELIRRRGEGLSKRQKNAPKIKRRMAKVITNKPSSEWDDSAASKRRVAERLGKVESKPPANSKKKTEPKWMKNVFDVDSNAKGIRRTKSKRKKKSKRKSKKRKSI